MSQFHRIERNDTAMKRSVIGAVLACALVAGSVEMNPAGAVEIGADVYSVPIDKSNIVAVDAGTEVVSIEELPVEPSTLLPFGKQGRKHDTGHQTD